MSTRTPSLRSHSNAWDRLSADRPTDRLDRQTDIAKVRQVEESQTDLLCIKLYQVGVDGHFISGLTRQKEQIKPTL